MTRPTLRSLAAAALLCIGLGLGGCAAPGGLGHGEVAPPVSSQPRPKPLWPSWTESPSSSGTAVAGRVPPPRPLDGALAVGPEGIEKVDVMAVLRADKTMRRFGDGKKIEGPGKAGVRPARFADLTGDGKPELIVAADSPTGRSVLSVYTAAGGKVVPILATSGRRMSAEILGTDLLVRTTDDDGSAHDIRYHWDGQRMSVLSDEHKFGNAISAPGSGQCPAPRPTGSEAPEPTNRAAR
ncbi:PliI family lysozyme inhibitor of I-type lysozyme [Streptomyces sp. AP-93]|uniref:PliI family lysozyme inhibitor of I-type lysozyme n=1 Tax=Streptomyces sp. AP-93 TaxID=2929048 RepID=UPI001FAE7859|nr:PliI family lysozyme inhibitor of I-type lysozyme [Streptomyces sp. AP-93]MCJ0870684.1 PliI family lysozyme inhibitor of I-type lysozyme [Streptomyces sp. AP-93]